MVRITTHSGLLASLIAGLTVSHSAQAALQSLPAISSAAEGAVSAALGELVGDTDVQAEALDDRLRLEPCASPLLANLTAPLNNRSQRAVVRVGCGGPKPWKLYVSVRIDRYSDIAVLVRSVPLGYRLSASDLRVVRRTLANLPADVLTTPVSLIGQEVRQPLRAGDVVRRHQVKAPTLVTRGQSVTILAGSSQFRVRMNGIVQSAGVKGGVVRVRNLSSGRMIQARVVDDRHVRALGASR
ncbi:MAG: flagellar basal body P-ring formation chaperone FlgA [Pseudomonadota bacterium]